MNVTTSCKTLAVLVALLPLGIRAQTPPATNTAVLDQSNTSFGSGAFVQGTVSIAQTFTPAVSGWFSEVDLYLCNHDVAEGMPLVVSICDTQNGLPGQGLGTVDLNNVAGDYYYWYPIDFSGFQIPLTAGNLYALVLACPGTFYGIYAAGSAGDVYRGGRALGQSAPGAPWVPYDRAPDLMFQTWMVPACTVAVSGSPAAGGSVGGGGTFATGSSVEVFAAPNAGYAFLDWTEKGAPVCTSTNYTFTVTTNRTLVANFIPLYTVTLEASPAAGGSVAGGGSFTAGSSVQIFAAANAGYVFLNWTENGTPVWASTNYTFTATTNRTLVANFAPLYTVTLGASPAGAGSVGGGGVFVAGSSVDVLAAANPGYVFLNWTEDGVPVWAATNYTFTATTNRMLVANFAPLYTVTATASPVAGGSVGGGGVFVAGSSVDVLAAANSGYAFANWTEAGVPVATSANYTFVAITNRTLVANFAPLFTITVLAYPAGDGLVAGGGVFAAGSSVDVLAAPNPGYAFVGWTENSAPVSPSADYLFTATTNRTLTAGFAPLYTVATTPSPAAGGSISGGGAYTNGAVVLLVATASPGFHFLEWTENGVALSPSNSLSLMVETNRNLVADFVPNPTDTITVTAAPSGAGWVSGGGTFRAGSSRVVTARASAGCIFANWTEAGAVVSDSASYRFTLSSNRVLAANFVPNPFPSATGAYHGLFGDESDGVSGQSRGSFTLSVGTNGAYSGSLQMVGGRYGFSGRFDFNGRASRTVAHAHTNALTLDLQLDLANETDRVTGHVSDGVWTAALTGDRAIYGDTLTRAPEAGSYTLILAGGAGGTNEPAGDSYGPLVVSPGGMISWHARLADGSTFTRTAWVSKYGQWPLYAPLYGGQGMLWGWLSFTNSSALGGMVAWSKPVGAGTNYPAGFSQVVEALGTRYLPPGRGTNAFGLSASTTWVLSLAGGGLAQDTTNRIALASNDRVTTLSGPRLALIFNSANGVFHGRVLDPATGVPIPFGGVVLQGLEAGAGFFLGAGESGEVRLAPAVVGGLQ